MASCRYTLAGSKLAGPEAHYDLLMQLLDAPAEYWKAQTPLPVRPVDRCALSADRARFAEFQVATGITPAQLETLMVLMVARMPQICVEFQIEGAADGLLGMRLLYGKLESGRRAPSGEIAWSQIPHHSTLIGSK